MRSASASVVDQLLTLMRIAALPFQVVPPIHAVPSAWTAVDDLARPGVVVAEAHEDLVEDDVIEHLDAIGLAQPIRHPRASAQQLFDQRLDALSPSERIAAYSAKPRARRELSSTHSQFSRCSLRMRYEAVIDIAARWAAGSRTATKPQS